MSLQGMLLLQLIMLLGLVPASSAADQIAKPGCPDKCGDVSIPYPFGTDKLGCSFNENFFINCNHSFNPPLAFLNDTGINVTKISVEDGHLHILNNIARDCYNKNGTTQRQIESYVWVQNFTISHTQNKFVAIGCDTKAVMTGYPLDYNQGYAAATGCMSFCYSIDYVDKSCSGSGCCQVSIPKGFSEIYVTLASDFNHSYVWKFNPCSYAFVVEEREFHFSRNFLKDLEKTEMLPMVLDWAIGTQKCKIAQKNEAAYLCKGNSTCIENDNGFGYRCKCFEGYRGNPYLHGCQDIDECENATLNQCEKREYCINKLGSYTCSCPKGHHGDGRKSGKGCIANQLQVIQVVFGIGICFIVLLVGSSWLYIVFKKRKLILLKKKFFQQNGGFMLQQQLSRLSISNSSSSSKIFTAEELKKATNNYDESMIVGRGGFGTVYKGILANNIIVAIKKSKVVDQNQIEQFINEVVVLSQINHRNVVKLLGCCLETEVPLLVYEFVTNGTLFDHIHDEKKASTLSWEIRLRIAAETAGVLSYLHSAASTPIIHRDVKPTNILLDDNYTAKVSDFGASRLVPLDQMQLSTLVQGTLGYLDPEYLHTSQLTDKSDVYSFGVILVELLTGKKAISFERSEEERSLAMYFLSSLKENQLFQVVNNRIVNEGNIKQLKEFANLAKCCLSVKGEERPTMKEVATELERLRMMEMHPWVSVELNSQEAEWLLGESSKNFGHGDSGKSVGGYDSVQNPLILSANDGR